jgi:hypothetical protein
MSGAYNQAWNRAKKYNKILKAQDFGDNIVKIITDEGATHTFMRAFLTAWVDYEKVEWLMCFTEHEGFHVWSLDELYEWGEYTRAGKPRLLG